MNVQRDRDLEPTHQVSMNLLPPSALHFGPWELAGRMVLAHTVGGDLFDFYPLGEGRYALSITSVWGRGLPAALLASDLRALLREHRNGSPTIAGAMKRLNERMVPNMSAGRLINLFYGEFDSGSGLLRYSNAGTNLALLRRRDGSLLMLREGGVMLGIAEVEYDEAEHPIEPGDSLLLCTGGIVEALAPLGIQSGVDRICAIWQQCADRAPESAIMAILAEVQVFRDRALHEEIETFPSILLAKGQETLRMEAEWLRKHPDQREDMTLVVLGSHN